MYACYLCIPFVYSIYVCMYVRMYVRYICILRYCQVMLTCITECCQAEGGGDRAHGLHEEATAIAKRHDGEAASPSAAVLASIAWC